MSDGPTSLEVLDLAEKLHAIREQTPRKRWVRRWRLRRQWFNAVLLLGELERRDAERRSSQRTHGYVV